MHVEKEKLDFKIKELTKKIILMARKVVFFIFCVTMFLCSVAQTTSTMGDKRSLYTEANKSYLDGKIDEAVAIWNRILTLPDCTASDREQVAQFLSKASYAKTKIASPEPVSIKPLAAPVNNPLTAEIAPLVLGDELTLYFTSDREHKLGKLYFKDYGAYPQKVYYARRNTITDEVWTVETFQTPVNSKGYTHDGTAGLSADGRKIFVYKDNAGLSILQNDPMKGITFVPITKIFPGIQLGSGHISSLTMSADETMVVFASSMAGGQGGSDLWATTKNADGSWSQPINFGPTINTPGNESTVSMLPDGKTIFFASNGHAKNMGGMDIYRSQFINGAWEEPVNLGYPINSTRDEVFYFPVSTNPRHAYYSQQNTQNLADFNIFFIEYKGDILSDKDKGIKQSQSEQERLKAQQEAQARAEADRRERERIANEARSSAEQEAAVREARLKAEAAATESQLKSELQNKDQQLKEAADREAKLLSDKGYSDINNLANAKVGTKVMLREVLFATGDAALLPESYAELNKVFDFLAAQKTLRLEVSGHTDNVGNKVSNYKLSTSRAQSVVSYLVGKGVDPTRLVAKGYADAKPIESNTTEEGRKLNRRVEFIVIE
ncbi:hypothetical protein FACS1894201_08200 [Bacteroidia bacterium]|nr:hypothetical protein FACS1894201_08200 [Bacteroidia bacterium]